MAPAWVLSVFLAPVAGALTDRIGGKYILMSGLALFAVGMGWAAAVATTTSAWYVFLAPLSVVGLGMGFTLNPTFIVATRNIDPVIAGAASGVLSTVWDVGLVIGTATVGALLENRLVSQVTRQAQAQAQARAGALPAAARAVRQGDHIRSQHQHLRRRSVRRVRVATRTAGPVGADRPRGVHIQLCERNAVHDAVAHNPAGGECGQLYGDQELPYAGFKCRSTAIPCWAQGTL